jgi:hypothetical protein
MLRSLGFRVQGLSFKVMGLSLKVLGSRFRVSAFFSSRLTIWGLGFMIQRLRVQGQWFGDYGWGFGGYIIGCEV